MWENSGLQAFFRLVLLEAMTIIRGHSWAQADGLPPVQAHAAKSKQDMTAYEKYDQPRMKVVVTPNKQVLGKTFKRQAKAVQEALEQMQVGHLSQSCRCIVLQHRAYTSISCEWGCD